MCLFDFNGKVAIITGATGGVGLETAQLLANNDAKITIVGRNETSLEDVAAKCKTNGDSPLVLVLDLTSAGACENVIAKTLEVYNRIDVLVNCAEQMKFSSLHDASMDAFDELMAINLRVPYLLTKLALPHLKKTKGCIINVGSAMSKGYRPNHLPYAISKSSLERLTKSAALEIAHEGVRINTVSPGVTRKKVISGSHLSENDPKNILNKMCERLPNEVIVKPKEVATVICLIASDSFPSVNGANVVLDGCSNVK